MRTEYPAMLTHVDQVEPVPRRIRGLLGGEIVFDTRHARYVWEGPYYPQYYVPVGDVADGALVDEGTTEHTSRGKVAVHGLRVGGVERAGAARVLTDSKVEGLSRTVRFEWEALDAWFEEDEQVYVHPRNPYVRVDALRSNRAVRVELKGTLLAESSSPVMVFETGLPTRYYLDPTTVDFSKLVPSDTVSECPYKGTTSAYWSVRVGERVHPDLAWSYAFPTRQLEPIAGLVAFYNEKVDLFVDGEHLERPGTPFSGSSGDGSSGGSSDD